MKREGVYIVAGGPYKGAQVYVRHREQAEAGASRVAVYQGDGGKRIPRADLDRIVTALHLPVWSFRTAPSLHDEAVGEDFTAAFRYQVPDQAAAVMQDILVGQVSAG